MTPAPAPQSGVLAPFGSAASAGPVVALLDGTVLAAGQPLLRADDLGVLRGEGVFETTLVVDGVPRDLDDHLTRMSMSADAIGLALPEPAGWRRAAGAVLAAWSGERQMVLRLVASRGPEGAVEAVGYAIGSALPPASIRQRTAGIRVLLLDRGFTADSARSAPWLLAGAKTLSYGVNMAALRYARAHGADDVIFLGADGAVLEAPTSTVVIADGRTLSTPPVDGILDGITVRRLFRAAEAASWSTRTTVLTSDRLRNADGVWLLSSARLLAPVTAIDGDPLPGNTLTGELGALLEVPQ